MRPLYLDVHDNEKFRNFHNKLSRIFRNMRYYISIDVYGNNAVVKNTRKGKYETAIKQNYK